MLYKIISVFFLVLILAGELTLSQASEMDTSSYDVRASQLNQDFKALLDGAGNLSPVEKRAQLASWRVLQAQRIAEVKRLRSELDEESQPDSVEVDEDTVFSGMSAEFLAYLNADSLIRASLLQRKENLANDDAVERRRALSAWRSDKKLLLAAQRIRSEQINQDVLEEYAARVAVEEADEGKIIPGATVQEQEKMDLEEARVLNLQIQRDATRNLSSVEKRKKMAQLRQGNP